VGKGKRADVYLEVRKGRGHIAAPYFERFNIPTVLVVMFIV
jgi:hypothetical protein